jgi:hypothetical protein
MRRIVVASSLTLTLIGCQAVQNTWNELIGPNDPAVTSLPIEQQNAIAAQGNPTDYFDRIAQERADAKKVDENRAAISSQYFGR